MTKEYLVKTRKDYDGLMRNLESKGITWCNGDKPTYLDNYSYYGVVIIVYDDDYITYSTDIDDHPNATRYVSDFCLNITEEQMREICYCPKGYMMNVASSKCNPFKISEDGYVYDKDDDCMPYAEFLCDYRDDVIEIVPEQPAIEEMTMEQVCKALGKNIKIVKE